MTHHAPIKPPECFTSEQVEAARLRVVECKTQQETADEIGRDRSTVKRWEATDEWKRYAEALRDERHRAIVQTMHKVVRVGGQARWTAIQKLAKKMAETEDPDTLVKLAAAMDRLTNSAEDRSGYAKATRHEVQGTIQVGRDLSALSDEELAEEEARLLATKSTPALEDDDEQP